MREAVAHGQCAFVVLVSLRIGGRNLTCCGEFAPRAGVRQRRGFVEFVPAQRSVPDLCHEKVGLQAVALCEMMGCVSRAPVIADSSGDTSLGEQETLCPPVIPGT
ncbi:MAG: hypothetical protein ACJ73U_23620 [Actinophytocola sp.]